MAFLRDNWLFWHILLATIMTIGPFGCSPPPSQNANPELITVPVKSNEAVAISENIILSLNFEVGTKTRYQVTTETVTAIRNLETGIQGNTSTTIFPNVSESSEVVFTQEILGPLPEDANTVVALITINQVKYVRMLSGQVDLAFDSQEPANQNSPFAKLIGQTYTIEIDPLGYVPGIFNLRPARLAVRGPTAAHATALEMVSPPAIFPRHGFFSLPGPEVGSLAVGDQWRGVQQYTLRIPGMDMDRLGTHRFEKIYRLESVKQQPVGTVAEVVFEGSPIPRRTQDGLPADVPSLSCSYAGGGEFNLDAGRIEGYLEHLEVQMQSPEDELLASKEGNIIIVTRSCWVQRLDWE
ncbi:MAG: hypothetical protein ACYS3S_15940 [Planctomycetota bacterium]|jgi:hypothetical protein